MSMKIDPGPYIGIVVDNIDDSHMGRVKVWIEQLSNGSSINNKTGWISVNYATPFYGSTITSSQESNSANVSQSYGMWFVPPDIGVRVLVTFANGNVWQGYWFACIPNYGMNHMIPGIAGRQSVPAGSGSNEPITEYNKNLVDEKLSPGDYSDQEIVPTHTIQAAILQDQGLLNDPARGAGTSTVRRETPSSVFGISTPGPRLLAEPTKKIESVQGSNPFVKARYGGHQFVMDDGDVLGKNQMIKLRSSQGGTIMINDTIGSIYVINQAGTAWVELTANGRIDVYGQDSISIHSEKDINLTADNNINISASNNLNIIASQINTNANAQLHQSNSQYYVRAPDTFIESDSLTLIAQKGQGNAQDSKYDSGLVVVADSGNLQFAKFEDGKPVVGKGNLQIKSFTGKIAMEAVTGIQAQSLTAITLDSTGPLQFKAAGGIYEDIKALPKGIGSMFLHVQIMSQEMGLITKSLTELFDGLMETNLAITELAAFNESSFIKTGGGSRPPVFINPIVDSSKAKIASVPANVASILLVMKVYVNICNWNAGVSEKVKKLKPEIRTSDVVPIPKPYINQSTSVTESSHVPIIPQHEPWSGHDVNVGNNLPPAPKGSSTGDEMFGNGKGMAFPEDTTDIVSGGI